MTNASRGFNTLLSILLSMRLRVKQTSTHSLWRMCVWEHVCAHAPCHHMSCTYLVLGWLLSFPVGVCLGLDGFRGIPGSIKTWGWAVVVAGSDTGAMGTKALQGKPVLCRGTIPWAGSGWAPSDMKSRHRCCDAMSLVMFLWNCRNWIYLTHTSDLSFDIVKIRYVLK